MRIKIYFQHILLAVSVLLMSGCQREQVNLEDGKFVDFAHLAAESLKNGINESSLQSTISDNQEIFDEMLAIMGIPARAENPVESWLESPSVKAFALDIDTIMPKGETILNEIAQIVGKAEKRGFNLPADRFATVIWGKPQSIMFGDSAMYIALNHYLGANHPAYAGLPEYRRQSKSIDMMPYDIAEALVATAYPYNQSDTSAVINRLVYEGLLSAAKMSLVNNAKLSTTLGYSQDELKWLEENEGEMWSKMVASKMIFDKSSTVADRLVLPSPVTSILSPDCPGRAGRYFGYKIVKSYLERHREATIEQLLATEFYAKANPLTDAKYLPQ